MKPTAVTREMLYELIWTRPVTEIAKDFGLSDVAVKKMCTRMQVPTPQRGYWARLAAGQKIEKPPLPPLTAGAAKPAPVQIDPEANAERREELQRHAILPAGPKDDIRIELPTGMDIAGLHPRARDACLALKKAKPEDHGRVELRSPDHPSLHVSQTGADRLARVLHVIYSELGSRGVELKPVKTYNHTFLGFVRGQDRVSMLIDEPLATTRREPTQEELRRPSREWKLETTQAGGLLKFSLLGHENEWSMRRAKRMEGAKRPIEVLLREVVEWVWGFLVQQEEARQRRKADEEARGKAETERQKREAEERRAEAARRAEEEVRRKETERQEKHRAKLRGSMAARVENLLRAAEWWRQRQALLDYLRSCETQWMSAAPGGLSDAQMRWLGWARAEAEAMSPAAFGYPDPKRDIPFEPESIPVGGPYPDAPELPVPPAFRAPADELDQGDDEPAPRAAPAPSPAPPPASPPPVYPSYGRPQFPYWLLHRGRR